ncbi:MAG: hypothetical protein RLZZ450_5562 [Pseudomonadota bacterium]|jgi:hypothetical protein
MLRARLSFSSSCTALLIVTAAGCGGSDDNTHNQQADFETDPSVLRSALENPIISCQQARLECGANAQDAQQRAACSDEFKTCLQTAADKAQGKTSALKACREEARECVAGDTELSECRSGYESCAKAALEGTADAGIDNQGSNDSDHIGGDAGVLGHLPKPALGQALPSLPSSLLDGGILAGLPKPEQCIVELRVCLVGDPSAAIQCGDEARLCLQP